ncbi:hypothetical protein LX36DRAFT_753977 [Colletotrichum falcatum]|nr:hypothetical protein LX36DRAFT_753977 [Colletotrichum falcatum]
MRSALLIHLVTYSGLVACVAAESCCWGSVWAGVNWLNLRWDEPAGVVRCGLSGEFPPNTKCAVATSKDANGNIQALTNVTFGLNSQPFQFRIGIDPSGCGTLPDDKVKTGWEGWGAYLFKDSEFSSQKMMFCDNVSANTHGKCYCKLNNVSNPCLTAKACEIYRTQKEHFAGDPAKRNVTTLFNHVCASMEPDNNGRMWYIGALGGNEFEQSCWEARDSGACPESKGGDVASICK